MDCELLSDVIRCYPYSEVRQGYGGPRNLGRWLSYKIGGLVAGPGRGNQSGNDSQETRIDKILAVGIIAEATASMSTLADEMEFAAWTGQQSQGWHRQPARACHLQNPGGRAV